MRSERRERKRFLTPIVTGIEAFGQLVLSLPSLPNSTVCLYTFQLPFISPLYQGNLYSLPFYLSPSLSLLCPPAVLLKKNQIKRFTPQLRAPTVNQVDP